jgi:photosystem II stability/assembly factor-like uncharacterized protein
MIRTVWVWSFLLSTLLAQNVSSWKSLKFREVGPANMGGRIDDLAVVESNTNIVYAATASAGVWKSVNSGMTWTPLFDDQSLSSIGDVTVAPSEPETVWVGTGESNNRQSSSWGNGVYKSQDGGKTWVHMGLKETHHIGRILIHPTNPNIVYVAAAGRLWGPNEERGVFKTTDGGKTWNKVLYINPDTGVNDLALDYHNPDTIYAAAYQRRRTVFGMNGGGPGSAIYRTVDGGATWKKLTKGLPQEDLGRIGLDVYRKDGNIVYALVESQQPGIFRSDDKGETWTRMSNTNPRPMYFSNVRIDPTNDQRIWVLGVNLHYSEDGGKTFRIDRGTKIHVDFHAMWIDPTNAANMIVGCDGGIHFSRDAGRSFDARAQIPLGQFYEVGLDNSKPYKICGGLQDNSTWCGPSATLNSHGITNEDWYTVQGGDGFYAQIDPEEPWIVYAESQDGNLIRRDLRTHEARSIRPREESDEMDRYRFQWDSPIVISKHDRKSLYYGGNFVFKSTDQGDNWRRISPDLTNNVDRRTLSIMGKKVEDRTMLARNDGVANFPSVSTLAESTTRAGIVWAGTDDGNLHVTRDGETWKNVTGNVSGVPKGTYVSRVVPSAHNPGTAYVAFDGHRSNDFGIYLYKTTDFGETWKPVKKGIPETGGVINVVREHPRNANLLFAGGEFGLYVSFDAGDNWQEFKNNLPRVPVDDIAIHPRDNDLVLGTHGRSVWILDSISSLEQASSKVTEAAAHVFDVRPAIAWRMARKRDGFEGHDQFQGRNPAYGAMIDVYFKAKPEAKDLKVRILDASGKVVRTLQPSNLDAGVNRIVWNLKMDRAVPPTAQERQQAQRFAEAGGDDVESALGGPSVDPGQYTVEIALGSATKVTKTFTVEEDPRITWFSAADRSKRRAAITELMELSKQADAVRRKFTAVDTSLKGVMDGWKRPDSWKAPEPLKAQAEALKKKLDELRPNFSGGRGFAAPPPTAEELKEELAKPEPKFVLPPLTQRIGQLTNMIDGYSAAPAKSQLDQLALVKAAVAAAAQKVDKLVQEDVAKFNKAVNDANAPAIHIPPQRESR